MYAILGKRSRGSTYLLYHPPFGKGFRVSKNRLWLLCKERKIGYEQKNCREQLGRNWNTDLTRAVFGKKNVFIYCASTVTTTIANKHFNYCIETYKRLQKKTSNNNKSMTVRNQTKLLNTSQSRTATSPQSCHSAMVKCSYYLPCKQCTKIYASVEASGG